MIETVSNNSSEDQEIIRKMTEKIKIPKRRLRYTKLKLYYNIIKVRIGDIDTYCEPDSEASVNIVDKYQSKALKRTNINELKPNKDYTWRIICEREI